MKILNHEDQIILEALNAIFIKKRGWIFKLPRNGEAIILLVSGGFDSVLLWGVLMDTYGLEVYPVSTTIREGELESLSYFSQKYAVKYPKLFHKVVYKEYKWSDGFTASNTTLTTKTKLSNPQRMGLFSFIAYEYAHYLKKTYGRNINTIIVGVTPEDARYGYEGTATCLRTMNLNLCHITHNYKWQFTGAVEEGFTITKKQLADYAVINNLALDKTWSCDFNGFYQCGSCWSCFTRRLLLKKRDTTIYLSSLFSLKNLVVQKARELLYVKKKKYLMINPHRKITIAKHVDWKTNPSTKQMSVFNKRLVTSHSFNESASFLWSTLTKGEVTLTILQSLLKKKFGLRSKKAVEDCKSFVSYCIKQGLLDISANGASR